MFFSVLPSKCLCKLSPAHHKCLNPPNTPGRDHSGFTRILQWTWSHLWWILGIWWILDEFLLCQNLSQVGTADQKEAALQCIGDLSHQAFRALSCLGTVHGIQVGSHFSFSHLVCKRGTKEISSVPHGKVIMIERDDACERVCKRQTPSVLPKQ